MPATTRHPHVACRKLGHLSGRRTEALTSGLTSELAARSAGVMGLCRMPVGCACLDHPRCITTGCGGDAALLLPHSPTAHRLTASALTQRLKGAPTHPPPARPKTHSTRRVARRTWSRGVALASHGV